MNLAAHGRIFLYKLKIIALGEFIPYEWLTQLAKGVAYNLKESSMLEEMGTTFLVGVFLIMLTITVAVYQLVSKKCSANIQNVVEKVKKRIFWNAFIRSSLQSYL